MQILTVLLGVLEVAAVIAYIAIWVASLVSAAGRQDLKHSRVLWILLIIFIAPLGTIIYYFVENRKKLGIWSIFLSVAPFVIMGIYAVLLFSATNLKG